MTVPEVPVVDIGALTGVSTNADVNAALSDAKDDALRLIIEQVRAAASEWGFFYIANHGLSQEEVDKFQETMRSFFHLPAETKRTIPRTATNARGFVEGELTKNKTDWKQCFDFSVPSEDGPVNDNHNRMGDDHNQWLDENVLPGFRNEMRTYYNKMEFISRRLLKVFAVALGEEPAFFDKFFHDDHSSLMRLNYYPVAPDPAKTMGVYHHTDPGALAVLLQDDDVATLQVFHRKSQAWVNVPPRKGTYTINIGDLVQVWSNDKFKAPIHRVLATDKVDRFSAPFFYLPAYSVQVEPIVVNEGEVANYRPFSWREFLLKRVTGNYADNGKENQIGDFKIHGAIDVANS
ncbi:2OG-Fe(II) oxygenase superfamily protein [Phytophthora cinnamomi]|uniref:2OG-Fe(II) oxygenase superfamily protein n=1 Tax=Phytophthora cinnamomi TaxID=4785 RepID=UPI002A30C7DF|nr:2OG-Fe(II) oxygenase superfamily protein [Phytophthora cinnamomi]KAJ8556627.1 hypothetical protein ON010_g9339 [Phytophthora cinnamomi]